MFVSVGGPTGATGAAGAVGATGATGATGPQGPFEYVHRGDPAAWDFVAANFVTTLAWTDLDLSAIVPAGAVAVHLRINFTSGGIAKGLRFRKNGQVNDIIQAAALSHVSTGPVDLTLFVGCDANRIIEYYSTAYITVERVVVLGWIV